jgi:hypothetical protein
MHDPERAQGIDYYNIDGTISCSAWYGIIYFRFELQLRCQVEGVLHAIGVNLQLQKICTKDHNNNTCMDARITYHSSVGSIITIDRLDMQQAGSRAWQAFL